MRDSTFVENYCLCSILVRYENGECQIEEKMSSARVFSVAPIISACI